MPRTLIFGTGNLASAVVRGWHRAGLDLKPVSVFRSGERLRDVPVEKVDAAELAQDWSEIWIGIKPQMLEQVVPQLVGICGPQTRLVSLMAGVTTRQLSDHFGDRPILRVMTNLLSAAQCGTSAIVARASTDDFVETVMSRMNALGQTVLLDDETDFEVATAVIGSGPAFIVEFSLALERAIIDAGWPPERSAKVAASVLSGSVTSMARSMEDREAFTKAVSSPGGTTEAGLKILRPHLSELMRETVASAVRRGNELANSR